MFEALKEVSQQSRAFWRSFLKQHFPVKMAATLFKNARFVHDEVANSSFVVQNGRFVALGSSSDLSDSYPDAEIIDLGGKLVLPGLIDAHCHMLYTGRKLEGVNLSACRSVAEILDKLSAASASKQGGGWLVGYEWDHEKLAEGRPPTRSELDQVSTSHNIVLWRVCYHVCACNSEALARAGVALTKTRKGEPLTTPPSATIAYENGQATGFLRETGAMRMAAAMDATVTREDKRRHLLHGLCAAVLAGLTAVQTNDEGAYDIYTELEAQGRLPLRVHLTVPYALDTPSPASKQSTTPPFKPVPYAGAASTDMLRCQRIKVTLC